MRRNTVITGLAFAFTLAGSGLAAAQSAPRGDRPRGAEQDSARHRGGRGGPQGMLLHGITLTSAQQSQLKTLAESQRKQFDAARPKSDGSARPEGRQARERGDTTGMGARRAQMAKQRETRIAAIRGILDAQQRTQFDKNVAEMKARVSERGRKGRPEGARKGEVS